MEYSDISIFFVNSFIKTALKVPMEKGLDDKMQINDKLKALRLEKKFEEDSYSFYPGATSEQERLELQESINLLIDRLIDFPTIPIKTNVIEEFAKTIESLNDCDSEDKERTCFYMEKIMDIFGIESSDGFLNTWLYGFDPNNGIPQQ